MRNQLSIFLDHDHDMIVRHVSSAEHLGGWLSISDDGMPMTAAELVIHFRDPWQLIAFARKLVTAVQPGLSDAAIAALTGDIRDTDTFKAPSPLIGDIGQSGGQIGAKR